MKLRPYTEQDWKFILDGRNLTRENYRNSGVLGWNEHSKYLTSKQDDPTFFIWIILHNNRRIGYLKLNGADLATVLLPQYQSKGLGPKALAMGIKLCKKRGIKKLAGFIKLKNIKSRKTYAKLGYKETLVWVERKL